MKIHEYQAKELFRKFNVPTPKGKLAHTAAEVEKIAEEFGYPVVVKAQVHAGGRVGAAASSSPRPRVTSSQSLIRSSA